MTKIEYRTVAGLGVAAGSWTVIADDGNSSGLGDSVTGYQPVLSKSPQDDNLAFSITPFIQDIGNTHWQVSFGVHRVHASGDAAALFIATHPVPFKAITNFDLRVTITTPGGSGGGTQVYVPNAAVLQIAPDPHSDASTFFRYSFSAGDYTISSP